MENAEGGMQQGECTASPPWQPYSLSDLLAHWERGELTQEEVLARWPHPDATREDLLRDLLRMILGLRARLAAMDGRGM